MEMARLRAFLPLLLCLGCLGGPLGARAGDDGLTPEQKKALAEMDAKIQKLKAEGKLPDKLPDDGTPGSSASDGAAGAGKPPPGCVRLKVGEAAVVSYEENGDSPTGLEARYGLSHPSADTYLVEVNLRFRKGPGYEGSLGESELNDTYRKRVSGCLAQYQGALKNERAGKSLALRLTDNAAVPVFAVEVVAPGTRAHVDAYPSDISCPVVLHEVLHVLGLPDEYADRPAVNEALKDCRPSAPSDSVMSNQWEALEKLGPQTRYSVEMCRCDKKGDACWELNQKKDGKKCPPGTTSFLKPLDPDIKTSLNVLDSSEAFTLNETKIAAGTAPPAHVSALYPAHFRAITEPGCRDVNESYYACAVNAYRYSKPPLGAAGDDGQGCLPKPEACRWGSHKWLE
jgi:hypothetical protein